MQTPKLLLDMVLCWLRPAVDEGWLSDETATSCSLCHPQGARATDFPTVLRLFMSKILALKPLCFRVTRVSPRGVSEAGGNVRAGHAPQCTTQLSITLHTASSPAPPTGHQGLSTFTAGHKLRWAKPVAPSGLRPCFRLCSRWVFGSWFIFLGLCSLAESPQQ